MHSDDQSDHDIEWLGRSPDDVDMAIGPVGLPGVYNVDETTPGMTAKYMAEQRAEESGGGLDDPGGDDQSQDLSQYAVGTLLINGNPEKYPDSEERIRIEYDGITDTEYAAEGRTARILADDPETETNESGMIVESESGDNILNDDGNPRHVEPSGEGYTIVTEEDQQQDDSDGEGDDSDSDDTPSGPTGPGGPGPGPDRQDGVAPLVPEGVESIETPPRELTVDAYCSEDTWDQLNDLRDHDQPFDVRIGQFGINRMGILDLSRSVAGGQYAANDVTISLKQFRQVTVRVPGLGGGGGGGGGTQTGDQQAGGVDARGWIDENNDGIDDITDEPIPDYDSFSIPGTDRQLPVSAGASWGFTGSGTPTGWTDTGNMSGAEVVDDPSISGDGSLRVHIGANEHYGMEATWDPVAAGTSGGEWQEMLTDWWLRVDPPADGQYHTKLFSIHNRDLDTYSDRGWASRLAAKNDGDGDTVGLEHYYYHQDQSGYGEHEDVGTIPLGQWVRVSHYVRLNSDGESSDGVAKIWLNNNLALDHTGLRWSHDPANYGAQFNAVVYYGGDGTAPSARDIYADEVDVFNAQLGEHL